MKKQKKPNKKHSGNIYDRIFRENIESIFIPLVERYMRIEIAEIQPLPDKKVVTIVRETDALHKVKTTDGAIFILHLQVQTRDDSTMVLRIAEIHGMLVRKYNLSISNEI